MVSIPNGTRTVWYQPCAIGGGRATFGTGDLCQLTINSRHVLKRQTNPVVIWRSIITKGSIESAIDL